MGKLNVKIGQGMNVSIFSEMSISIMVVIVEEPFNFGRSTFMNLFRFPPTAETNNCPLPFGNNRFALWKVSESLNDLGHHLPPYTNIWQLFKGEINYCI